MLYETWLRGQVWQRRPDRGGGIVLDPDMQRAAEAFQSLVQVYKQKNWDAIKEHARNVYDALI